MTRRLTSPDGTTASPFAFGTMQFGGKADAEQSRAMYEACRAAGITHFDTAHIYTDGESEKLLGEFVAPERDKLVIATKVGYTGGAGVTNMRSQLETSRQRLGLDTVDLLYLHRFDPETELSETFEGFREFVDKGWIRHVGLSNFAAWQTVKAAGVAAEFDLRVDVIQPMYNLVKRQAEVEILPMAEDLGILVAPYSPLGGGLLTGKYETGGSGRLTENDRYAARYGNDAMHEAARGLTELARELRVDPATLAVAWVARHPAGPNPIVSARSVTQLAPSLAALDYTLDDETYDRMNALMPAPPPATDRTEEA